MIFTDQSHAVTGLDIFLAVTVFDRTDLFQSIAECIDLRVVPYDTHCDPFAPRLK
jgi:hypothetical protein